MRSGRRQPQGGAPIPIPYIYTKKKRTAPKEKRTHATRKKEKERKHPAVGGICPSGPVPPLHRAIHPEASKNNNRQTFKVFWLVYGARYAPTGGRQRSRRGRSHLSDKAPLLDVYLPRTAADRGDRGGGKSKQPSVICFLSRRRKRRREGRRGGRRGGEDHRRR